MYEPGSRQSASLGYLWPAFLAASASDMSALVARHFANLAVGAGGPEVPEPKWSTPHLVALELKTVRLRSFGGDDDGQPALLCTPLALHGAAVADLTPGHSLVAALRQAGMQRLFAADWRSAKPQMRYLGIDEYLADLNVLVDRIGAPLDLIGLCQGGWMALTYAARFPEKVSKLVLAGAPIDVAAAPSALSDLAATTPLAVFDELVRIGEGIVPGRKVLKFWGVDTVAAEDLRQVLQTDALPGSGGFARLEAAFREWYGWTTDLPGAYFLEVVEKLYKRNELALGKFVALGEQIDLKAVRTPIFLLAASEDELVAEPQLFAVERLVGTSAGNIRKAVAPCRHVGLFMGKKVLEEVWPGIVRWVGEPVDSTVNTLVPSVAGLTTENPGCMVKRNPGSETSPVGLRPL
jgi:poly(3-hydroxybutyrate) depolymerase